MTEPTLNIVVVDDNDALRELLVSYLAQPSRQVFGVDCGEELNKVLQQHKVQIVVLDVNLPYEDGFSIAQRLHTSHPDTRIVMLTARVKPSDRSNAYQTGVDVFLNKPTNPQELEAVVVNLATRDRKSQPQMPTLVRAYRLLITPDGGQLLLTPNESLLLEQLTLAPERELHTEALLEQFHCSGSDEFGRDNLIVMVSRLRKKLAELGLGDEAVKAVRGFGYRLEFLLALA